MPNAYLPQLAARALGIYERHGITIELAEPPSGPRNLVNLARGEYDISTTSVPYYLWARDDDPDLDAQFVFMTSRRTHMTAFVVEGRPAAHGRPITSFADLAGASFAMPSTAPFGSKGFKLGMWQTHWDRIARDYAALLARLGLDAGPTIRVGDTSPLIAGLAGLADVSAEWVELGVGLRAEAAAQGLGIRSLRFADAGVPGYLNGFVATGRTIRERPDALGRFVAAVREAMIAVRDDPAPALDLMAQELPDQDRNSVLERWRLGEPAMFEGGDACVGKVDAEGWAATLDYHVTTHGTRPFDPATAFDVTPWERALSLQR